MLNFELFHFRSSNEQSYHCFERDDPPVDTEMIFESNCKDIKGNIYEPHSEYLSSCCQCLM